MRKCASTLIGLALILVLALSFTSAEAAAAPNSPACGQIHSTSMSSWDMSQTRDQGHFEIVETGLHVWTESNTSLDKVAGYYPSNVALTGVASGSIVYTAAFGITPGLNMVVDFDGNGSPDGILVGEAVYGQNWWLSNGSAQFVKDSAPHTGGGNGSNWFGTLTEWGVSFPSARILAFGFSLGSGVHGDGVIEALVFGCYTFTFGLPGVEPPAPPVVQVPFGGFTCRVPQQVVLTEPVYAQRGSGSEWVPWDGFVVQDQQKLEISLHAHFGESADFPYYRVVGANGGELLYLRNDHGICTVIEDPIASD